MGQTLTLQAASRQLAEAMGNDAAAALAARALLEAELLAQPRFGLDLLKEWEWRGLHDASQLTTNSAAIDWQDCSTIDTPIALAAATLALEPRARQHGIAATFLKGMAGFGRFAPFVRHLANQGLAALAGTNGPAMVAPHGGHQGVISTNPFAFALGRGEKQVVIDVATAAATLAAVRQARASGLALPEGVGVDAHGRPTTDAAALHALLPRGGQLGSLLGLIVELLAGVMAGGRESERTRGVFLLAINPEAAGDSGWPDRLAHLQHDWANAGGHWPTGRPWPDDTPLPAECVERLNAALQHLQSLHPSQPLSPRS